MSSPPNSSSVLPVPTPWLHRFALLTAIVTFGLIGVGGLVTSHEAGLAVPDWPNTYGYNMFLFPFSKWMGGIFYEHSHRLLASFVGLLTTILAGWLWVRETRSPVRWAGLGVMFLALALMGVRRLPVYMGLASLSPIVIGISLWHIRRQPGTLRWWGMIAFAAVILQGVLGGLRVVLFKDQIGIFHATLAQLFFVIMCVICLLTSPWGQHASQIPVTVHNLLLVTTLLVLGQLVLGATMRHQHAGLAIPDFPLAYGKFWPAMDAASVSQYNQVRQEVIAPNPITGFQIGLQMVHRMIAGMICLAVAFCAWTTRRQLGAGHFLSKLALAWLGMILLQALLGAGTIWSNKAADIATAHVLVGALSLAAGVMISVIAFRGSVLARVPQMASTAPGQLSEPFGPQAGAVLSGLK